MSLGLAMSGLENDLSHIYASANSVNLIGYTITFIEKGLGQ
jgi:hypothetical protein